MRLTFLGTSAANAFPEPFCQCANCTQARIHGGPGLRKRSVLLINHDLLIDLVPDVLTASMLHGHPFTSICFCLQTHAHADHLDPSHFLSRSPGFGVVDAPRLYFYASPATLRRAARTFGRDLAPYSLLDPAATERLNATFHEIYDGLSVCCL